MRRASVTVFALLFGGCCAAAPCSLPGSDVLVVQGYEVVSATSNCGSPTVLNGVVNLGDVAEPATCHFDVRLDDGQKLQLDVLFATKKEIKCCGTFTRFGANVPPPFVVAPPGYQPRVDAG